MGDLVVADYFTHAKTKQNIKAINRNIQEDCVKYVFTSDNDYTNHRKGETEATADIMLCEAF